VAPLILQMMISLDGMASGPEGVLDWIAEDEPLVVDHLERIQNAAVLIMGAGMYPGLPRYWHDTAADDKASANFRAIGEAINKVSKVIYSHHDMPVDNEADKVHVVADDKALIEDIERLKRETDGSIVTYGGIRFARTLLKHSLLDEVHLDVCPVILGQGEPLFTGLIQRTNLRMHTAVTYDSGATMLHYDVLKG
jgi:dihydrofolate reductase